MKVERIIVESPPHLARARHGRERSSGALVELEEAVSFDEKHTRRERDQSQRDRESEPSTERETSAPLPVQESMVAEQIRINVVA